MLRIAAVTLLGAVVAVASPAKAVVTDRTPYYMCFAYTADGMFFAGGDFNFKRAQKMVAANCGLPRSLTVVLLKTIMVRRNGKTRRYQS